MFLYQIQLPKNVIYNLVVTSQSPKRKFDISN